MSEHNNTYFQAEEPQHILHDDHHGEDGHYRIFFENMPQGAFCQNADGRLVDVNPAALAMLGLSRNDFLGKTSDDFRDALVREDGTFVPVCEHPSMVALRTGHAVRDFIGGLRNAKTQALTWISIDALPQFRAGECSPYRVFVTLHDITERRRMYAALEASERRLRTLFESVPTVSVQGYGPDATIHFWNKASETVYGYTSEEAIGRNLVDLIIPPEMRDGVKAAILQMAETGVSLPAGELSLMRKDGTRNHVFSSHAVVPMPGRDPELFCLDVDIGELKRAEEALSASAAKLLSIFRSAPTGIGMVVNRIMTEVNDRLCQISGYSREELIGQSVRIFYVDDAEFQWVGTEKYRQMAISGTGTVETKWRTKDGQILNVMVSSTPINPADFAEGITFVALDITERKRTEAALRKSEEKFSGAFRISPTVLTISEPDTGRYLEVNDAFTKVLGYSRDEVIGKTSLELGVWLTAEERQKLQNALKPTGELVDASARMRSKDGKVHDVSISAKLLRYEDREDLLAIIEDVTEKKKLEAQLIQSQKMESVGRLAGGVAHDYNNMLAVIFFSLALIKNRISPDDPAMDSVLEIERAATRSRDITRQLLAFSRKQLIAPKPCDLNVLITDLEKSLARLIGEDIELVVTLQKGLDQVLIDPSQVDQILVNLAVNARDAMPEGGRLIIETANTVLDDDYCAAHADYCVPGSYVRLRVCDNGIGMDRETLDHIFEPFFTTKEVGKGTGLGLATVFGIIKQNNGCINAYSVPGMGTEFSIYLPRVLVRDTAPEQKTESAIATGSETILLVEDDAMLRRATKRTLESFGYAVDEAAESTEALRLLEQSTAKYDLLLTDVVMPGMNGAQLRDRIVAMRPGIRVLFMSGYTTDAIVCGEVLQEGLDFIQKPFSVELFAEKIREVLDRRNP